MIDLEMNLEDLEKEIDLINEKVENSLECYRFVRGCKEEKKFNLRIERECKEELLNIYKNKCLSIKDDMVALFKLSGNIFIPEEYFEKIGSGISGKLDKIIFNIDNFIEEGVYL